MYARAYDPAFAVLVSLFGGPTNTEQDYARFIEAVKEVDRRAFEAKIARPVAITVVDPGNPLPDAGTRKRIAEGTARLLTRPAYCLVSENPLVRGVLTAVHWVRPPAYDFATVASWSDALRWVAEARAAALPSAKTLYEEARAELRKSLVNGSRSPRPIP